MQRDLTALGKWCNQNDIYVSTNKTKFMLFGSKHTLESVNVPKLFFGKEEVSRARSYNYLGITLDEQLNYESHRSNLITRVSHKVTQLKRMRFLLSKKAALSVYKNMILPIVEYGNLFFYKLMLYYYLYIKLWTVCLVTLTIRCCPLMYSADTIPVTTVRVAGHCTQALGFLKLYLENS